MVWLRLEQGDEHRNLFVNQGVDRVRLSLAEPKRYSPGYGESAVPVRGCAPVARETMHGRRRHFRLWPPRSPTTFLSLHMSEDEFMTACGLLDG